MRRLLLTAILVLALGPAPAPASGRHDDEVRFSTFNASLNRSNAGQLVEHLSNPDVDDVSGARRATSPRSSSGSGPTCC